MMNSIRSALNKDTQLCMSLASRPGNFGTRFHNYLYEALDLNFVYKAFTTTDLEGAVRGIRALGIRGCAVSMPFKEAVMPLLDSLDDSAARIGSVNTIVNSGGHLKGYNTDYLAVKELILQNEIDTSLRIGLLGSGGMAKAVVAAFQEMGFKRLTVLSRNENTGKALAEEWGYEWRPQQARGADFDILVNVTPIGMAPDVEQVPFTEEQVSAATVVFDAVANPPETNLIKMAKRLGRRAISGHAITTIQAREQFVLYTSVSPPARLVERAADFARDLSSITKPLHEGLGR